jgi:AmiR/NasT family two-component response regulator
LQERASREQGIVAGQLQVALNSRVIIEQAKGILAERLHVTPDHAFLILRDYSRNNNRPLTQLAGDVIAGTSGIVPGREASPRPAGDRPARR